MDNNFLIPANSKKSMLYFGLFNKFDLIMFSSGLGTTLFFLLILPINNLAITVLAIMPGFVTGFLVLPVPNYHNVFTVFKNAITFYTSRQKFVWKGWCFTYDEENEKQIH